MLFYMIQSQIYLTILGIYNWQQYFHHSESLEATWTWWGDLTCTVLNYIYAQNPCAWWNPKINVHVHIHTHTNTHTFICVSENSGSITCLLYDLRSDELTWSNTTMTSPDLYFSGANLFTKSWSPFNTCVGSMRRGCISEQVGLPCSLAEKVHAIHHKLQNILLVFMKCPWKQEVKPVYFFVILS